MGTFRAALLLVLMALPVWAQDVRAPTGGVLVIDQDKLFSSTAFGRRISREVEEASAALQNENALIEAALEAEERSLTDQRPTLSAAEFRGLADAFDGKVQRIRSEQKAKSDAILAGLEDARLQFLEASFPILAAIMREKGAVVILNKRTVFLSVSFIDITGLAVERIDAEMGDGSAMPQSQGNADP